MIERLFNGFQCTYVNTKTVSTTKIATISLRILFCESSCLLHHFKNYFLNRAKSRAQAIITLAFGSDHVNEKMNF